MLPLMIKTVVLSIVLLMISPYAFSHRDKSHARLLNKTISTEIYPWGREGDVKRITRTININMRDTMRFVPDVVNVKQGETIKFVVKNNGKVLHEMVIGSSEELAKHADEMKKFPNMEHDEPYMAHVMSGKKSSLVWHFTEAGTFMFACLIPGHFDAGMKGTIIVSADTSKAVSTLPTEPPKGTAMKKEIAAVITSVALTAAPQSTLASSHVNKVEASKVEQAAVPAPELIDGEIKKIDKDAKKITIKHGVIKNMDMPAMTMVFQVADIKLLENIKVGDKVKFSANQGKGAIVVIAIEVAK